MLGSKTPLQRRRSGTNTRLRRLTQAYLTPISQVQPTFVRTAYDRVDNVYYLGISLLNSVNCWLMMMYYCTMY